MPIDTSIYGQLQPGPAPVNPFAIAMQAQNMGIQRESARALQAQREALTAETEQKAKDRAAQDAAIVPGADLEAVLASLPGHLHAGVRKQWADADNAAQVARDNRAKADAADADYFGTLAATVKSYGYDPTAAKIVLAHAKAQGHDTTQIEALLQQNPNGLQQVVDGLLAASPAQRALMATEAAHGETVRHNQVSETETNRAHTATEKLTAAGQAETARNHRATEAVSAATNRREQAKYDQTYGAGVSETGAALPVNPLAKAIAEYRVPPPTARALTSAAGMALMRQVEQVNPSFDASQFPARNRMRTAFTSGPQGQTLNSLNTAIEHLDQLKTAADALGNGSFKPGNAAYNWVREQFGSSAPTNFDGMKTIMAGELASAFKKSGATDQEIAQVKSSLERASSPRQLGDYVTKIAIPALGSKAATFGDQWRATMGDKDPFSVYTPGAQRVLDKYGASRAPAGGGKTADPMGIR